jgi:hypothetical protein
MRVCLSLLGQETSHQKVLLLAEKQKNENLKQCMSQIKGLGILPATKMSKIEMSLCLTMGSYAK